MSLESLVEGVRSELEQQLEITVVDGFVEGPLERELGCVYPGETEEDDDNKAFELLDIRARIYKAAAAEYTPEAPAANAELFQTREAIIAALAPKQAAQLGVWFFRIVGFTFDARDRWVEARITAWTANPFTP